MSSLREVLTSWILENLEEDDQIGDPKWWADRISDVAEQALAAMPAPGGDGRIAQLEQQVSFYREQWESAVRSLRAAADARAAGAAVAAVPDGIVDALRSQQQADEDGVFVKVSREAVDVAAGILERVAVNGATAPTHHDLTDDEADRIAHLVECSVGMSAGGWDMVRARDIIRAAHKVMRTVAAVPEAKAVPYGSVSGDKDYAYGYEKGVADGWNACRRSVLAAAPQPEAKTRPQCARQPENCDYPRCGCPGIVEVEAGADDGLDYAGECSQCGTRFIGHKRQVVCGECWGAQPKPAEGGAVDLLQTVAVELEARARADERATPGDGDGPATLREWARRLRLIAPAGSGEAVAVPVGEIQHPCNATATTWLYEPRNLKHGTKLYAGAPPADAAAIRAMSRMKDAAMEAHRICYETMKRHPSVPELADDGVLHKAIHAIVGVDTPQYQLSAETEALIEELNEIIALGRFLRSGGPDAIDLQELSDALSEAVQIAERIEGRLSGKGVGGHA